MRSKTNLIAAAGLAAASIASVGGAFAETAPSDVVFKEDYLVEKSLTGSTGDATAGRGWFIDRKLGNCLACHANAQVPEQPFHGEVGPPLDGVADRYGAEELRAIIVNPKTVFGDHTIMPSFYRVIPDENRVADKFAGKTILSAAQVEDVIAYLLTLKEE